MRVLLHCVYYPPEVGGLESHVGGLAEGLARRGHAVTVVTSRSHPDLPVTEERNGVRVFRTPLPSRTPTGWAAHALGSIPRALACAAEADLLHAQTFASVLPVGIAATARGHLPWLASFHTSHFLSLAERPGLRPFLGALVRWPRYALAASEEIASVARGLAPGTRVEALVNGVDTDRFRPSPPGEAGNGGWKVLVPRRLVRKNGVEFLVRAAPLVLAALPETRFVLVGDGPERQRLEELARELGVAEALEFLGSRPHSEMPQLLRSADLAVLPSLMEATSVAALEAMACGLPVVATEVGGLPEIVDASVGALVPPADPHALARGVVTLLTGGDLAGKGVRARARVVERWSNERLVDRHLEIYADVLAGRTPAPATERRENR